MHMLLHLRPIKERIGLVAIGQAMIKELTLEQIELHRRRNSATSGPKSCRTEQRAVADKKCLDCGMAAFWACAGIPSLGELATLIYQGGLICVSREKPRFGLVY
jgi:hypothetical protein